MASAGPSTGSSSSSARRRLRVADVLAEIFNDSDSAESTDSDGDAVLYDSRDESETEVSDVAEDSESDEQVAQEPPAKQARRQKASQQQPKFVWSNDPIHPQVMQYTGLSEINPDLLSLLPDEPKPLDFLTFFVHDELVEILVRETKRYAEQHLASAQLGPQSRSHMWTPTNLQEMKLFLAMSMLMGVVHKPTLDMYWTKSSLFATPAFGKLMPRNRYCLILKYLHFSNNDDMPDKSDTDFDRLFKIREVYDILTSAFMMAYTPGRDVCIDEGMIRWFGCGFRTYLPSKRAKYGMKAYKLCEDSGYTYRFQLYTGQAHAAPSDSEEHSPLERLVLHLMGGLLNQGRVLYMDNYYNSPTLAKLLYQQQTHVVGTLRMNRKGVPKDLAKLKLKPGDIQFRTCDPITVLVWHDKRNVNVISTLHDASLQVVPGGKVNRQTGQLVSKPAAVLDYNKHMGSVDKSDQMVLVNSSVRKTLKWTKKLFFHLLDLSVTNAFILYCKQVKTVKHLNFVKEAVEQLVTLSVEAGDITRPARPGRFSAESSNLLRLEFNKSTHWPVLIPATAAKKNPRRECIVCKSHVGRGTGKRWVKGESRKRVETKYVCGGCDGQPALCVTPCFRLYHTQRDY